MRQQLIALRAGLHPVTGLRLPAASGSTAGGSVAYSRLKTVSIGCEHVAPYIPTTFDPPVPCGESAERKRWLLRGRVLCRPGREAAKLKRLRRKRVKEEVREVIRSFINADEDGGRPGYTEVAVREMGSGDSDEEFWLALPTIDSRTSHIQSIPTQPSRSFPGRAMRSRVVTLDVGCNKSREG